MNACKQQFRNNSPPYYNSAAKMRPRGRRTLHGMKTQDEGGHEAPPRSSRGALSNAARKHSVIAKILIIAFLLLLLLWPLLMFQRLVHEREQRRQEVESEIMGSWGGALTVAGPFLSVPYIGRTVDANGKRVETMETARFLPYTLVVEGTMLPQRRSRGMYDVTVYSAKLNVSGTFGRPDFSGWRISPADILWDQAVLSVELPDMRALQDVVPLTWAGQRRVSVCEKRHRHVPRGDARRDPGPGTGGGEPVRAGRDSVFVRPVIAWRRLHQLPAPRR